MVSARIRGRGVSGQDLFMWCPESAAFGGRREVLVFTRQRRRRRGKKRKKRMLPSIKGRRMRPKPSKYHNRQGGDPQAVEDSLRTPRFIAQPSRKRAAAGRAGNRAEVTAGEVTQRRVGGWDVASTSITRRELREAGGRYSPGRASARPPAPRIHGLGSKNALSSKGFAFLRK